MYYMSSTGARKYFNSLVRSGVFFFSNNRTECVLASDVKNIFFKVYVVIHVISNGISGMTRKTDLFYYENV